MVTVYQQAVLNVNTSIPSFHTASQEEYRAWRQQNEQQAEGFMIGKILFTLSVL